MTLYFQRSNGDRVLLGEYDRPGVFKAISDFLDQHNYTSYYTRVMKHGDEVHLDVGSWSEKFVVIDKEGEWDKDRSN